MPSISVVMPVYNVAEFVGDAIQSVLDQHFQDWELIIVNDCSPDNSMDVVSRFRDPRIRVIEHTQNRGLAGARNSGIRAARSELIAFLDSDDTWAPEKLQAHYQHLLEQPTVGVSFSRSVFMDAQGQVLPLHQMPRLKNIEPTYYLRRNPIGNGSAPVIRRRTLDAIACVIHRHGVSQLEYFDEDFRQSEDIECWIRIVLQTSWLVEGIPQALTRYRLNAGGLSAALYKQLQSWEQMACKLQQYAPTFARKELPAARGYQLRYLARQAVRLGDGREALKLGLRAIACYPGLLWQETGRTALTLAAAMALMSLPRSLYEPMEARAQKALGAWQTRAIHKDCAKVAA